jgi:hypothetical protein
MLTVLRSSANCYDLAKTYGLADFFSVVDTTRWGLHPLHYYGRSAPDAVSEICHFPISAGH